MTGGALLGGEQLLAPSGRIAVETAFRWLGSGNRQLKPLDDLRADLPMVRIMDAAVYARPCQGGLLLGRL